MSRMPDKCFFMLMSMVTAVSIAVALYYINSIYASTHGESQKDAVEDYADIFSRTLDINGRTVNTDITLSAYDKRGKAIGDSKLGELTGGRVCIVLLSANNCTGCVRNEVSLLNNIVGKDRIIYIFDSPVGDYVSLNNIPASRYYEIREGELSPGLEKGQELPVLLYVEDGRVTASCSVSNSTESLTREFHKFLKKRLNDE